LESLNEKYGLLRSCGLPPEEWLNSAELSIARVKQLKQLRKRANELIANGATREIAYRNAFVSLTQEGGNIAGFTTFGEFLASPVSRRLFPQDVWAATVNIDGNESDDEEDGLQGIHDATSCNEVELLEWFMGYPVNCDAVIKYALQHLILESRELFGKQGLVNDPEFFRVVQQHREYKNLSKAQLLATLQRRLETIIKENL
jgi:hypothetical protein